MKKHTTMQHFYHEPWDELQQKIVEISKKEENPNVIRTLGLAEEEISMSESK